MDFIKQDPLIVALLGGIFFCSAILFWLVGKLKKKPSALSPDWAAPRAGAEPPAPTSLLDENLRSPFAVPDVAEPKAEVRIEPGRPAAAAPMTGRPGAALAMSREVADRLEGMNQRLVEMQAVLMRQTGSSAPAQAGAAVHSVGQGLTPETIDKLLKIIGNVMQQVDVLQKGLTPAKGASTSPPAPAGGAPGAKASTASSAPSAPVAPVAPSNAPPGSSPPLAPVPKPSGAQTPPAAPSIVRTPAAGPGK
jgi:hypothetical protein